MFRRATPSAVVGIVAVAAVLGLFVWSRASSDTSPWLDVAPHEEVMASRVIYVEEAEVFVVADGSGVVALRAQAPHVPDDLVLFCPTSGWFEGAHGERFDALGRYALGPASAGLTRVGVRVDGDMVQIDPSVELGTPNRDERARAAEGPFCSGGGELLPGSAPGYAAAGG